MNPSTKSPVISVAVSAVFVPRFQLVLNPESKPIRSAAYEESVHQSRPFNELDGCAKDSPGTNGNVAFCTDHWLKVFSLIPNRSKNGPCYTERRVGQNGHRFSGPDSLVFTRLRQRCASFMSTTTIGQTRYALVKGILNDTIWDTVDANPICPN